MSRGQNLRHRDALNEEKAVPALGIVLSISLGGANARPRLFGAATAARDGGYAPRKAFLSVMAFAFALVATGRAYAQTSVAERFDVTRGADSRTFNVTLRDLIPPAVD